MPVSDPLGSWANSGAMWLSGRADGPPLVPPGDPAGLVIAAIEKTARSAQRWSGRPVKLPGPPLLGERAALLGLRRAAPASCGGAFAFVRTRDGHLGLSLARPHDVALIPALLERDVPLIDAASAWEPLQHWAITQDTAGAVERARLLGMAAADVRRHRATAPRLVADDYLDWAPGAVRAVLSGGARTVSARPRIVDFSALWAGPLCAHLLGLADAEVIKVEAHSRLDGARRGNADFYDLLHAGHAAVAVDPQHPGDRARLRELVAEADLVVEASRPRALRGWGLYAEEVVAEGTSWLSITARGRESDTIGFGDDLAADAGLLTWEGDDPRLCGDALADPLSGVVAAAAASQLLAESEAQLLELSMIDVCHAALARPGPTAHRVLRTDNGWVAESGAGRRWPVREPVARWASRRAPAPGADNERLLR